MGITGNHSHFIRLSIHPKDVMRSLQSPFHISDTLEVQNRTHAVAVPGDKVGWLPVLLNYFLNLIDVFALLMIINLK